MATSRPRIAVTLNPEAYESVRYLALASDTSMSKVIAEIVHTIAPVFSRTADILSAAKQAQHEQREGFQVIAQEAEARLAPLAHRVAQALDVTMSELERATGRVHARSAAPARPRPPSSNTGVRSPRKAGKKQRSGKGRS